MIKKSASNKNNQWTSAAARRLLDLANNPSTIEEAIKIISDKILEGVDCPPTNLEAIAEKLNVVEILAEDLPVSGELRRNGKKLVLVYSKHLSPGRKRFTIAHELGHAIFENSGPRPPRVGDELERICDMFASELLMPNKIFSGITTVEPSTKHVLDTADLFKTSLFATSIRYSKLRKVSIFYLEENAISWGCGIIKKGSLNTIDFYLKDAIKKAVNDELTTDMIYLNHPQWRGECTLDYSIFNDKKRALFMLKPIQRIK